MIKARKISKLHFNWHMCGEYGDQWGEDYNVAEVGEKGCNFIEEYIPSQDGEKWYYDIHFIDGTQERIFNPNRVFYTALEEREIING